LDSLCCSAHCLFWRDEIFTVTISCLRDRGVVWKTLCEGTEEIPPFYVLITRSFDMLFGHADFGVRVPSALALGVVGFCLYGCFSRPQYVVLAARFAVECPESGRG
jgi:hypothetical protein